MNRNLLFLLARVYTIKSSQEQNFKSSEHVDPVSSLALLPRHPSFWTGGELDKSSFLRSPARTFAGAFKKFDTKGGRDASTCQAKISDLSLSPSSVPPSGGQRTSRSPISYDILSFSLVARARLRLVTKISIFVSFSFEIETTRERETESTWPHFARRPFLPLHSPRDIYRTCLLAGFARISLVHVRSLSYIFFQPRPKGHAVFVRSFPWKRVLPAALFRRFFRLVLPSGYLTRGRYFALFRLHNFISTREAATQVSSLFIASDSTLLPV